MALQKFDELNNYFSVMEVSNESKNLRIKVAKIFCDCLIDLFYLMALMDGAYAIEEIKPKLIQALQNEIPIDTEIANYIQYMLQTTVKIAEKHSDDEWYLSDERAYEIAINEANSLVNYEEYQEAKLVGATQKTWVSMKDEKVRTDHFLVDEEIVAINDNFIVGGYSMRFPHDPSAPSEQIINCRCAVIYS